MCHLYLQKFALPSFSPLSCYQKQLAPESVQDSSNSFLGPLRTWIAMTNHTNWQQVGKTHVGFRKLRASWLSLGWCSKSNPSNTSGTAVASRVSIPPMCAMAFLLGIWNGHRLLFPAPRDSWGHSTASPSHITSFQWQCGKRLLSTVFLLVSALCLIVANQNVWKADARRRWTSVCLKLHAFNYQRGVSLSLKTTWRHFYSQFSLISDALKELE